MIEQPGRLDICLSSSMLQHQTRNIYPLMEDVNGMVRLYEEDCNREYRQPLVVNARYILLDRPDR